MKQKGDAARAAFAQKTRFFPRTDTGNAAHLVALSGKEFRYVKSWGRFVVWTGTHWAEDVGGIRIAHLARESVEQLTSIKWKRASESRRRREAIVALVTSEPGVAVDHTDFDKSQWLLNVQNGTLDLRTGVLRKHRRKDLITKIAPVRFHPHEECPEWLRFLNKSMGGDQTLIDYLQRWAGYSFTGSTRDQALIFHYGDGNNGKSTFIKTLERILGNYATRASRGLLFRSRNERHPTSLANLAGRRFVSCSEIDEDQEFDEGLVKDLSGGDSVNARFMRQDEWIYVPQYKLWLAGNEKPRVKGTNLGIWRRLQLVPWEVIVAPKDIDKKLDDKLWMEASGILNWAVAGAVAWRKDGLMPPSRVLAATAEYRKEQDAVGQFFDERLTFEEGASIARTRLRGIYETWCEEVGYLPVGARKLGHALRRKHVVEGSIWDKEKAQSIRSWVGARETTRAERRKRRSEPTTPGGNVFVLKK